MLDESRCSICWWSFTFSQTKLAQTVGKTLQSHNIFWHIWSYPELSGNCILSVAMQGVHFLEFKTTFYSVMLMIVPSLLRKKRDRMYYMGFMILILCLFCRASFCIKCIPTLLRFLVNSCQQEHHSECTFIRRGQRNDWIVNSGRGRRQNSYVGYRDGVSKLGAANDWERLGVAIL